MDALILYLDDRLIDGCLVEAGDVVPSPPVLLQALLVG